MQMKDAGSQSGQSNGAHQGFSKDLLRHGLLSVIVLVLFLLLNRPEVILISGLGSIAWYPATGLVMAVLLAESPGYAIVACVASSLAGLIIYHQPLLTWGETVGSIAYAASFAAAAYV